MAGMTIKGTEAFTAAVTTLMTRYPEKLAKGLIRAGLVLKRESQKIVPIKTGVLKDSAYSRKSGKGKLIKVKVGYQASYAIFVHEMVNNKHKPGKVAKYLSRPLKEKQGLMINVILNEAK